MSKRISLKKTATSKPLKEKPTSKPIKKKSTSKPLKTKPTSKSISLKKTLLKEHHKALETLVHLGPKKAQTIINNSPNKFLHVIRTIAKFILDGTIPLEKHHVKKLRKHRQVIRGVAKSRGLKTRKAVIQKGGSFFQTVLSTILPMIPMLL